MAFFHAFRTVLYVLLWLFSAVLLGLSAHRLWYTLHLPEGDPLNGGKDFYDGVVAELVAACVLTIFWVPYIMHTIHKRKSHSVLHTFTHSLLGLFILTILFIVGAAVSSHYWGDLGWCHGYFACRLLTVLVAFAWMCAIASGLLFLLELWFAANRRAWKRPMHAHEESFRGRWFGRV